MVRKKNAGEEGEFPRQLSLEIWANTYAREVTDAEPRRGDAIIRILEETGDKPNREDFSSVSEYLDAMERYERVRKTRLDHKLREEPLQKAEKAAIRGTHLNWQRARRIVFERDKGICQVCGEKLVWDYYECGHIVDRCVGGSDRLTNLVAMCRRCNALKPEHKTRAEFDDWVKRGGPSGDESGGSSGDTRRSHTKQRLYDRVKRGLHPSTWPLGYAPVRDEKGNCIGAKFADAEREAVEMLTRLFLDGVTYIEMVARMRESPYVPRGGGQWARSTVRGVMLSDVYAGYIRYGGIRATEKSDKYPALWDEETYQAVLRERANRHQDATGGPPSSPLTGLVVCARCGWNMRVHRSSTKEYFCCSKHSAKSLYGPCHPNYISLDEVEHYVEEKLAAIVTDADIDAVLAADTPDAAQLARDLERAQARADKLADQEAALLLLQSQASDAGFTRAMEMLAADQAAANAALKEAKEAIKTVPDLSTQREALRRFADLAAEGLESGWLRAAGIRQTRRVLLDAGVLVLVEDGEIMPGSFGYPGPLRGGADD